MSDGRTTWNYRIVRDQGYSIHEVYYENGNIIAWSADPIHPYGEDKGQLLNDLEYMGEAFRKPVLRVEELPQGRSVGAKT